MGDTPLLNAVKYGHSGVVKLLLEHPKINPNLPEAHWGDRNTPLHIAVNRNREDIIKLLVAHPKIDITIKNKKGQTALDIAESKGYTEIANMIRQRDARHEISNPNPNPPLPREPITNNPTTNPSGIQPTYEIRNPNIEREPSDNPGNVEGGKKKKGGRKTKKLKKNKSKKTRRN